MLMTLVNVSVIQVTISLGAEVHSFVSLVDSDAYIACLSSESVYVLSTEQQKLSLNWFCVTWAKKHYILLFDVFWHVITVIVH